MSNQNTEWISVSDVMTGLMMVFLFVSLVFMQEIQTENENIEKIAVTYEEYQTALSKALLEEFREDLVRWNAEILSDNTVRFNEPDVLFAGGSADIRQRFKVILNDFFPRYVSVLGSEQFKISIDELRIEGHTSSNWLGSRDLRQRYLNNAKLSQQRSFAILTYCFTLPQLESYRPWLTKVLRANGLAFAKPIVSEGREDRARSRRVEFKVKTKADEQIRDILETIRESDSEA